MSDDVYLAGSPPDLVGQNRWISGFEKAAQSVQLRLGRFRGEWFLDPSSGLRWMSYLGTRNWNAVELAAEMQRAILGVENVVGIQRMESQKTDAGVVSFAIDIEVSDPLTQTTTVLGLSVDGTGRVVVL